jgi:hypothetical protein
MVVPIWPFEFPLAESPRDNRLAEAEKLHLCKIQGLFARQTRAQDNHLGHPIGFRFRGERLGRQFLKDRMIVLPPRQVILVDHENNHFQATWN